MPETDNKKGLPLSGNKPRLSLWISLTADSALFALPPDPRLNLITIPAIAAANFKGHGKAVLLVLQKLIKR
ncbi:hypothetical protein KPSB59_4270044 [Klebsiella quasipneumoniae subsp. quasipneumoniae]|nr:hypothetical protein KPSB59_4270044 [Klebsiella quasipneumoniae subsp. quasipneumoniae]